MHTLCYASLVTDRSALPPYYWHPCHWPEPRTDPPDDDPDGIEAALEKAVGYFWCETCRAFVDDTTYADGKGGLRHTRGSTIAAGYDGVSCGPVVLLGEDE